MMAFEIACGQYVVGWTDGLPSIYDRLRAHARLVDEIALEERGLCCVTVRRVGEPWPFLVVAQSREPAGASLGVGALIAGDTLFVGAGERVLVYDLLAPRRVAEDGADTGFHGWEQHGDVILMAAELELAAWDARGSKLWSMFVEPPWSYTVRGEQLDVDVMGAVRMFELLRGPA
ncbi:MAG: hypothetical protein ACM31C_32765 [Acidobacteriota bacterium]